MVLWIFFYILFQNLKFELEKKKKKTKDEFQPRDKRLINCNGQFEELKN